MRHKQSAFLLAIIAIVALPAIVNAQVVQLPQFQYTTGVTTVLVPDQGEVIIGSISRAQDGRSQFGLPILGKLPVAGRSFNNVGISRERSKGTLSVRAHIHDFEAMDEALLGQAAAQRGGAPIGNVSLQPRASSLQPLLSVAEIERRRSIAEDEQRFDIANLLAKAQAAEVDGRPGVARIFYGMVAKQTKNADERVMVQQRIVALARPSSGAKLATNPR